MAVAGTMCTSWSSRGLRRGLSDEATEPWHVLSLAMAISDMDIVLLENSDNFPHELWADRMQPM
eukprot:13692136-Alexandrium_andersonii.AAC.1